MTKKELLAKKQELTSKYLGFPVDISKSGTKAQLELQIGKLQKACNYREIANRAEKRIKNQYGNQGMLIIIIGGIDSRDRRIYTRAMDIANKFWLCG